MEGVRLVANDGCAQLDCDAAASAGGENSEPVTAALARSPPSSECSRACLGESWPAPKAQAAFGAPSARQRAPPRLCCCRNTTLRFGRILSRCRIGTLQAPAAARGAAAAVAPPLAVRAGVDPGGGREAPPPATKRPKREKKRPTHFLALQASGAKRWQRCSREACGGDDLPPSLPVPCPRLRPSPTFPAARRCRSTRTCAPPSRLCTPASRSVRHTSRKCAWRRLQRTSPSG